MAAVAPEHLSIVLYYADGIIDKLSAFLSEGSITSYAIHDGEIMFAAVRGRDGIDREIQLRGRRFVDVGQQI